LNPRIKFLLVVVCALSAAWVVAQESLPGPDPLAAAPPTGARHYSYAIGRQIGESFRKDEVAIDADNLLAGLKDALAGAEPKFSAELCEIAMQRMFREQAEKMRLRGAVALKEGAAFLAKNAKAPGVTVLPSGLQYKVIAAGNGPSPKAADTVRVNYRGTFIDGTLFDESGAEPAVFPVNQVIDGWTEALQKMKVGDKWQLAIPSDLAYGPDGNDAIPPNSVLMFEVELLGIEAP
jgi:FKBP-type peptidyl-prolyl cis-trans isomerase FklB